MSAAKKVDSNTKWQLSGSWAGAYKVFGAIGGLGLVASLAGAASDTRRFAFSWLFAVIATLAVALGATFFVLIQRLTGAGWSVTVRRTAEFFSNGLLVMIPLALPILLLAGHLFPWMSHGGSHDGASEHGKDPSGHSLVLPALVRDAHAETPAEHGAPSAAKAEGDHAPPASSHGLAVEDHGAGPAHGASPVVEKAHAEHKAHELIHHTTMNKKSGYLNREFFIGRAFFYFLVWAWLATKLFGYSTSQDKSKDPSLTLAAQRISAPGTFLFGLTLTFAGFDWVMSLEPSWFSTIFGVYYFATGVVSSLAVLILVTMSLRDAGILKGAMTVEHFHDLGKLLFGFNVFWAYIGFSQFMLIWYAALPEETTWYHNRWDFAPWSTVSLAIVLGHFVMPFLWLISRNFKRNLWRLKIGATVLLVMHVVDIYWFVMPNYLLGKNGFAFHWLDLTCFMAVAGLYGAFVFFRMTKHSLVPVGDPRLARSLEFQNA